MLQTTIALLESGRAMKSIFFCFFCILLGAEISEAVEIFLFLLFSYIWNDYIDADMDVLGHPKRPIPSGRLSESFARNFSVSLFFLGFCLDSMMTLPYVLSGIYSPIKKRYPKFATSFWVLSVTLVVTFKTHIGGFTPILFFILLYLHELYLDFRDKDIDHMFSVQGTWFDKGSWLIVLVLIFLLLFGVIDQLQAMHRLIESDHMLEFFLRNISIVLIYVSALYVSIVRNRDLGLKMPFLTFLVL